MRLAGSAAPVQAEIGGTGGDAQGGTASFLVDACDATCTSNVSIQDLLVYADGSGGNGGNSTTGGIGGNGTGGSADVEINNGTTTAFNVEARAFGNGGNGGASSAGVGGAGGTGRGGESHLTVDADFSANAYTS